MSRQFVSTATLADNHTLLGCGTISNGLQTEHIVKLKCFTDKDEGFAEVKEAEANEQRDSREPMQ